MGVRGGGSASRIRLRQNGDEMADTVMVAGAGKSGMAAAHMLLKLGGAVLLYDSNADLDADTIRAGFDKDADIRIVLGELREADLKGITLCIISPGIPLDADFVDVLDRCEVAIWSEIQLAYSKDRGQVVAITGTNGKTTTTTLTGELIKRKYPETYVVGNIGLPYTETALMSSEHSMTVLEVSSFQLETIADFRPHVSAILNITPDHLNRHHTMENYIRVKEDIASNQTKDDYIVLNYEDEVLREFGRSKALKPRVIYFSSLHELDEGIFLRGDDIIVKRGGQETVVLTTGELQILGRHNHENAMAAIAMAMCCGVDMEDIRAGLREFKAVEHRIEFVRDRGGVKFYNDSKGTNPDAAIKAIQSMPGRIVLIAGGYDKNSEYDEWIESFDGRVKELILMGQTREAIERCARAHGFGNIVFVDDMEEAVRTAYSYADMGDCVLLSPACASWGMFKNYEERGRIFKECVMNL